MARQAADKTDTMRGVNEGTRPSPNGVRVNTYRHTPSSIHLPLLLGLARNRFLPQFLACTCRAA